MQAEAKTAPRPHALQRLVNWGARTFSGVVDPYADGAPEITAYEALANHELAWEALDAYETMLIALRRIDSEAHHLSREHGEMIRAAIAKAEGH